GMSLLVTSPNLAYTVLPQEKSPLTKALWFTILATALPDLLYQNSGYVQWGFRAPRALFPDLGLRVWGLPLHPRLHDLLHGPPVRRNPPVPPPLPRAGR